MVSNPLAGWWGKNKKKVIIGGVAVAAVWVLFSSGDTPKPETVTVPEDYPSANREVIVQAPGDPDNPLPLVIILHDNGMDAAAMERASEASSLANRRDFALAFPEAVGGTWRVDDPNGPDAQYVKDVIQFMDDERTDIDKDRIYIWGIGEGARLALTLACSDQSPGFAAVGVVGQFDPEPQPMCEDVVPIGRVTERSWDEDVTDTLWEFSRDLRRRI